MSLPLAIADYSQFNRPPYLLQFMVGGDMEKLAHTLDRQYNDLEAAAWSILNGIWLDNAYGKQLDVLGLHLNLSRIDRDDEAFRTLMRIAIILYNSSGQPDKLINTIKTIYNAANARYVLISPKRCAIINDGNIGLYLTEDCLLENDDTFLDNYGNSIVYFIEDNQATQLIAEAVPSGTELLILNMSNSLVLDNGDSFVDDSGNSFNMYL